MTRKGWFKSSYSMTGNCVEASFDHGDGAAVRDSKANGRGPVLVFSTDEWVAFVAGVRDGEFDAAS